MKIATTKPFLLKPYSVSQLADDSEIAGDQAPAISLPLGRALLRSSTEGTPIVVAATRAEAGPHTTDLDYRKLAKGVVALGGEIVTAKAIAQGAWHLSSLSTTTTPEELTKILLANHVGPDHAKNVAENALTILSDPITKGILISISAGVATYVVVQRTTLTTGKKWAIIISVMTLVGALFAVFYQSRLIN